MIDRSFGLAVPTSYSLMAIRYQPLYEFSHTRRFSSGIALDHLDDCAANHCRFGILAHCRKLFRCRNSEADGNRKLGELPQPPHQRLRVVGYTFLLSSDTRAGDSV